MTAAAGPRLVEPTPDLHPLWRESWVEWGPEGHQDGSGLNLDDEVESPAGFARWVDRLRSESDHDRPLPDGKVHATYWWILREEQGREAVVGSISLRHELNDYLLAYGGHIGYSVRPSARRQGLAGWALREVLARARARGLTRVLVTCDDANTGSARTIEGAEGVLEDVRPAPQSQMRRYWIDL